MKSEIFFVPRPSSPREAFWAFWPQDTSLFSSSCVYVSARCNQHGTYDGRADIRPGGCSLFILTESVGRIVFGASRLWGEWSRIVCGARRPWGEVPMGRKVPTRWWQWWSPREQGFGIDGASRTKMKVLVFDHEVLVLVLVLNIWSWSWSRSWRKSLAVFQDFCCNSCR